MREYSDEKGHNFLNKGFENYNSPLSDILESQIIVIVFICISMFFFTSIMDFSMSNGDLNGMNNFTEITLIVADMVSNPEKVYSLNVFFIEQFLLHLPSIFDHVPGANFIDNYKFGVKSEYFYTFLKCFSHENIDVLNMVLNKVSSRNRSDAYDILMRLRSSITFEEFKYMMTYANKSAVKDLLTAIKFYYFPDSI